MDDNLDQSRQQRANRRRNLLGVGHRRKPPVGYIVAMLIGASLGAVLLLPLTADLDDAGGTQTLIGGFLGLTIYHLLF